MLQPGDSRGRLRTNILEVGVEGYDVKACNSRTPSLRRWIITRQKPPKIKGTCEENQQLFYFCIGEEKE
jgi:hypothetical protein